MRIESFWARGFRSLRDVRLEGLGPFNVLYGENGSGKSNILAAIHLLLGMSRAVAISSERLRSGNLKADPHDPTESTNLLLTSGALRAIDLNARDESRTLVLGARFVGGLNGSPTLDEGPLHLPDLTLEFTLDWLQPSLPMLEMTRLESAGESLFETLSDVQRRFLHLLLSTTLPSRAYTLVNAVRLLAEREEPRSGEPSESLTWQERGFARQILRAQLDARPAVRRRLDELRALLEGPPLHRPPFFPVQDERTGRIELHERLPEPNPEGLEIPIDLAGLGVAQLYAILAQAMLSGARVVAVEEPEAHLHGPTSGLHLRKLLRRLVDEHYIDQIFVATHSNLFDLDEGGFWDVRLEDGETKVQRKPLDEIDRHLWEPGPTVHALEELLKLSEPERVMFRRPGGVPVTAREMLVSLRAAEPEAIEYLGDLHHAAVDVVGLRARRKAAS